MNLVTFGWWTKVSWKLLCEYDIERDTEKGAFIGSHWNYALNEFIFAIEKTAIESFNNSSSHENHQKIFANVFLKRKILAGKWKCEKTGRKSF